MTVSDGSMYLSDCVKRKSVDYVMETLDMIVTRVNPASSLRKRRKRLKVNWLLGTRHLQVCAIYIAIHSTSR